MKNDDLFTPSERVAAPIKAEAQALPILTDDQREAMITTRSTIRRPKSKDTSHFDRDEFNKLVHLDFNSLAEKLGDVQSQDSETETALKKLAISAIKKNQYAEAKVLVKALTKLTDK